MRTKCQMFDKEGYLIIESTPSVKLFSPPFEKMEGYPNFLIVGSSFSGKSFVTSAIISRIKQEYRKEVFIRVNGADKDSSPVYPALERVFDIKFYPEVSESFIVDIEKEANEVKHKIFVNIIDDPLKYFDNKNSKDIANFFTYSRHKGIINIMQIQILSGTTAMTLNQIIKNSRVIIMYNGQTADLDKFKKKAVSGKITEEKFDEVFKNSFEYDRAFLVAITDAIVNDLFIYANGKFIFKNLISSAGLSSREFLMEKYKTATNELPERKKFKIEGNGINEKENKMRDYLKASMEMHGTSSRAMLLAAKKNDIDLQMIEKLEDLIGPGITPNKWYLYSIGNVKGSDGVKHGHWIIVKISYEKIDKTNTPIVYFITSQQLSNKAIEEFKKFYTKFKISIIPFNKEMHQPIYDIFDKPDTTCGAYILYYLKHGNHPNKLIPYQKFTFTDEDTSIKKGEKIPKKLIINNDETVLTSKVGKDLMNIDKSFGIKTGIRIQNFNKNFVKSNSRKLGHRIRKK